MVDFAAKVMQCLKVAVLSFEKIQLDMEYIFLSTSV